LSAFFAHKLESDPRSRSGDKQRQASNLADIVTVDLPLRTPSLNGRTLPWRPGAAAHDPRTVLAPPPPARPHRTPAVPKQSPMRSPRGFAFRSRCGCPVAAFVTLTAVGGLCLLVALHPVAWPQQLPPARVSWRPSRGNAGRRVISSTSVDDAAAGGQLRAADAGANAAAYQDASSGQLDISGAPSTDSAAVLPVLAAARASQEAASAHRGDAVQALPGPARRAAAEIARPLRVAAGVKTSAVLSAPRVGPAREPPGHATLAICLVTRVDADDPQWVDGRAEDLHEASDSHTSAGSAVLYSPYVACCCFLKDICTLQSSAAVLRVGTVHGAAPSLGNAGVILRTAQVAQGVFWYPATLMLSTC